MVKMFPISTDQIIERFISQPVVHDDGSCFYCSLDSDDISIVKLHWDECIWRLAVEYTKGKVNGQS